MVYLEENCMNLPFVILLNDLCPSSARTYNLNKVSLPSDKSIHTLVDPYENQGESTLVCELPTTSENMNDDQPTHKCSSLLEHMCGVFDKSQVSDDVDRVHHGIGDDSLSMLYDESHINSLAQRNQEKAQSGEERMSFRLGEAYGEKECCLDPCIRPLFLFEPSAKCEYDDVGTPNLLLGLHSKQNDITFGDAFTVDAFLYYLFAYGDIHASLGFILCGGRIFVDWSTCLSDIAICFAWTLTSSEIPLLMRSLKEVMRQLCLMDPKEKGISSVIRILHTSQVASLLLRKRDLQLLGTWTSMLSGYAKNERFCDAVDVFEAMLEKNIVSHNAMLSLYLGIGDFMSARQVFDKIGERNVACWKAMINGYVKCYREVKHGMYGDLGVMQGSNKWLSYPPSFKQAMEEYIDSCTCALLCRLHLSRKIMRGIALALGGSADEMEGEMGGDPFWVLRIIGYPAASISNGHDRTQNDVGCDVLASCVTHLFAWNQLNLSGTHTHYGLLTLVNQDDDIVALQVSSVLDHEDLICREVPGWSEYLVDFGGLLVNFTSDGGCRTIPEACLFPSRVSDTGASFRFHTRTSSNLNDNLPVNSILEIDFYGRLDFQNQN
ncbi:hypothetical protein CQW23_07754 [Capsicum baccatum]|uniref:Pentatricopeptide repeat-containing protein n=1 Tax=Capsicum baccatum TaxID=33114 RepID=A0A2G2X702_CAPBA|nr:hypothetical protein CQW23_07754 [Capsicum baccatum]